MPQPICLKFLQMMKHVSRVLRIASGSDQIFLRALPPRPPLGKMTKYLFPDDNLNIDSLEIFTDDEAVEKLFGTFFPIL